VVSYLRHLRQETSGSRPKKTRLALDIETHGDIDVLHPSQRPLVCVGMFDGSMATVIPRSLLGPADYEGSDWAWPEFLAELTHFDLELHNGIFDIPTLTSRLADGDPEESGVQLGFDTMVAHYILRPAAEQGLKPVAKALLGVDDWDKVESFPRMAAKLFEGDRAGWWKHVFPVMEAVAERVTRPWTSHEKQNYVRAYAKNSDFLEPSFDELVHLGIVSPWLERPDVKMDMENLANEPAFMVHLYNAYDVLHTWMMRDWLEPALAAREGAQGAYEHLNGFDNAIMWDELSGFPVDTVRGKELMTILTEEADTLRDQLIDWAHTYVDMAKFPRKCFNPNSWQQVMTVYASVGVKLKSTNEKTMSKLAEKGDKFAKTLLKYRSVMKELGTYAIKAAERTNNMSGEEVMYPWYNRTSTLTGRLSSSGVTNIQNWPKQDELAVERRLRTVFVASRLGPVPRTLVQVDYSQAELRVMAALSGDDWLTDKFRRTDLDIFTQMTGDIFPHVKDPKQIKLWRRPLKSVVYGLAFGRQAKAIAVELGIPVEEAQTVMDGFLLQADELSVWREWIMREAVTGGDLVTRFGRRFQHEVVNFRNKASVERSALSFLPQSTASDITLKAYVALRKWIKANKRDWIFRAVVHDALTYDTPVSEAQEAQEVISRFMIDAATEVIPEVPFAVDGNIAQNWAET